MSLTVETKIANIERITNYVNEQLDNMKCSRRAKTQIDIALDELFSNICNYAYGDRIGHATIRVQEIPETNSVSITLEDGGIPFDPLAHDDPDISLGIHERAIGGLGIFMVKKTMNAVKYEYRDGLNILTVVKSL
ncbi:MAG: ATP-binding protein [Atopobiaceae bacterium]|nr:ATP-binding protein [Atopobiaceae bacterium]